MLGQSAKFAQKWRVKVLTFSWHGVQKQFFRSENVFALWRTREQFQSLSCPYLRSAQNSPSNGVLDRDLVTKVAISVLLLRLIWTTFDALSIGEENKRAIFFEYMPMSGKAICGAQTKILTYGFGLV